MHNLQTAAAFRVADVLFGTGGVCRVSPEPPHGPYHSPDTPSKDLCLYFPLAPFFHTQHKLLTIPAWENTCNPSNKITLRRNTLQVTVELPKRFSGVQLVGTTPQLEPHSPRSRALGGVAMSPSHVPQSRGWGLRAIEQMGTGGQSPGTCPCDTRLVAHTE